MLVMSISGELCAGVSVFCKNMDSGNVSDRHWCDSIAYRVNFKLKMSWSLELVRLFFYVSPLCWRLSRSEAVCLSGCPSFLSSLHGSIHPSHSSDISGWKLKVTVTHRTRKFLLRLWQMKLDHAVWWRLIRRLGTSYSQATLPLCCISQRFVQQIFLCIRVGWVSFHLALSTESPLKQHYRFLALYVFHKILSFSLDEYIFFKYSPETQDFCDVFLTKVSKYCSKISWNWTLFFCFFFWGWVSDKW